MLIRSELLVIKNKEQDLLCGTHNILHRSFHMKSRCNAFCHEIKQLKLVFNPHLSRISINKCIPKLSFKISIKFQISGRVRSSKSTKYWFYIDCPPVSSINQHHVITVIAAGEKKINQFKDLSLLPFSLLLSVNTQLLYAFS